MITVAVVALILLNLLTWGAVAHFYRRDKDTLTQLLSSHREERKCDQERIDALVEALANSKGVPFISPSRNYSGELIPTQTWWGDQDKRYWDVLRPIVEHEEEKSD